ncbi:MAG: hypothetical protein QOG85_74 [Gaiellaceae bacterium]|jgi:hypothetical protein|nr:hypothetical protein [Gaiellaceae bacterium]
MNDGLTKLLDFWPGQKEQGINILGMLGGLGAMATLLAGWLGGGVDAKMNWQEFAAAYAAFHFSAQQFSKRLAADRAAREQQAVTLTAVSAAAPAAAPEIHAAVAATSPRAAEVVEATEFPPRS